MKDRFRLFLLVSLPLFTALVAGCQRQDTANGISPASSNDGQKLYLQNCAVCHGPEGEGVAGKFPPLQRTPFVTGPPKRLVALVLDGMAGEQVIGDKTYRGVMPAWRGVLSDEQVAAVTSYVRNSWGNPGGDVSGALVDKVGKEFARRQRFWKPAELARLPSE